MPQISFSGYFREELEQRIWGKGPPGKPDRVLFSYTYRKQPVWWMTRPGRPMEVFQGLPWCTSGWDFPSNAGGEGSIPGQGAGIPHASLPKNQNIKQKQCCNKVKKDFKNGPHQKNLKKKSILITLEVGVSQ